MAFTPTLAVQVESDGVGPFRGAMDDAAASVSNLGKVVGVAGAAVSAFATGALAVATNQAADFEEAMVEVEKVTSEATANALSGEIRELAETIPLAQEELAAITADAGRFGIEGTESIRSFTESVARMATATTLSADEAGESLAKLSELTNTPIDEVENLGSAVNALSNNMATSAQEVVDSMMRSSAALSTFGLNQRQIAGIGAALNEVSASARRAGTRLRRVAQELMDPKKVAEVSSALGMSTEEFQAMRDENPEELFLKLSEAMAEDGEAADKLRQSLSTVSRQALSGLAQNLDGTREALEMSNEEYDKGTSLQKEFDAATDTFNSKLQLLKNRLNNVAIEIGNVLLPYLTRALTRVNDWISSSDSLINRLTAKQKAIGLVASAIGGAVAAITGAVAHFGLLSSAVSAVGTALTVLTGPVGIAIAAIGLLALTYRDKLTEIEVNTTEVLGRLRRLYSQGLAAIRRLWDKHGGGIISALKTANGDIQSVVIRTVSMVKRVTQTYLSEVKKFWNRNLGDIIEIAKTVGSILLMVFTSLTRAINRLWRKHGAKVARTISNSLRMVLGIVRGVMTAVIQILKPFLNRLETFWANHGRVITNLVVGAFGIVIGTIRGAMNLIRGLIEPVLYVLGLAWKHFGGEVVAVMTFVFDAVFSLLGGLLTALDGGIKTIQALGRGDWREAWNVWVSTVETLFGGILDFVTKWGEGLIDTVVGVASQAAKAMKSVINDTLGLPFEHTIGKVQVEGETIFGGKQLEIPALAEGGIVEGPGLFMAGEAGPEAVIPLDKADQFGGKEEKVIKEIVEVRVNPSDEFETEQRETVRREVQSMTERAARKSGKQ